MSVNPPSPSNLTAALEEQGDRENREREEGADHIAWSIWSEINSLNTIVLGLTTDDRPNLHATVGARARWAGAGPGAGGRSYVHMAGACRY